MKVEYAVGIAGAAFVAVNGLIMLWSLRRGQDLCRRLRERFPDEFAAHGKPRPAIFDTLRGSAYYRFVLRGEYSDLSDPLLREEFSRLRRIERWHMWFTMTGLAAFGIVALAIR